MTGRKAAICLYAAAFFVVIISAVSCGYDRFGELGVPVKESVAVNAPLEVLMQNYAGAVYTLTDDLVFEGWVTANDLSGNFFRTFVIQDQWGAVEIDAGFYDLHNDFPVGRKVIIEGKGLAAGQYSGIMQVGRTVNPYGSYRVESFSHPAVMGKYIYANGAGQVVVTPEVREISSLVPGDCGKLIRIENVVLNEDERGTTWAFPGAGSADPAEGVRNFLGGDESVIAVVTSGYADFAGEYVPECAVSLTGILMYGKAGVSKERFAIKLRDLADVEQGI